MFWGLQQNHAIKPSPIQALPLQRSSRKRGACLQQPLPWLKLSLGTTSILANGERNGVAETRLRTHTRGTLNNNTLCQPGATILVCHPAPSGATGSGHQRHCALSRSWFIYLEGSSQTELFLPNCQAFSSPSSSTLNPLDHKVHPQRLSWPPNPEHPYPHPLQCLHSFGLQNGGRVESSCLLTSPFW